MLRSFLLLALAPLLAAQENPPAPTPPPQTAAAPAAPPDEQILLPPEPGRFKLLFQRFRTEHAALSPDGRHLAYSVSEGGETSVVIVEIDHPEKARARVTVVTDDIATPMLSQLQYEKTPGRIRWMRWVTSERVVVETNRVFPSFASGTGWSGLTGAVLAFDLRGEKVRRLVEPNDVPEFVPPATGLFSTVRIPLNKFHRPVWTADQPVSGPGLPSLPSRFDDNTSQNNVAQPGVAREMVSPESNQPIQPRTVRVFDLDPSRPGAVIVAAIGAARSSGSSTLGYYSLDTATGRLSNLHEYFTATNRSLLVDRQGRPRLTLPNNVVASFPFSYEYLGAEGRSRPRRLGETTGLAGFSFSPDNYFGERAVPLGFDEDANLLYYASNLGRDTYGIHTFNLSTGQRDKFVLENPGYDVIDAPKDGLGDSGALVFDRYTRRLAGVRYQAGRRTTAWLRPEWQKAQNEIEQALPGRSVELVDWDEAGRRFLVSTEGPADPGAFHVYERESGALREFVRRAPWIDAGHAHATLPFGFTTTDGTRLTGLVTVPLQPRMKPTPMVVLCPDEPWERVTPDFQTEVSALAGMGFVVAQLNGRGAWGFGLKQRQSLTAGYDLLQVEDLATTVATLGQLFHINPRRVALMGRGHGGFIALRALQTYPDRFRCAIALETPVDLADWLDKLTWNDEDVFPHLTRAALGDEARLRAAPLVRQPGAITKPVLLLAYPGSPGEARRTIYLSSRRFAEDVRRGGTTAELAEISLDYMRGLPAARAEVFDRIENFLNEHIYDYKVKLRDLKILPDKKP